VPSISVVHSPGAEKAGGEPEILMRVVGVDVQHALALIDIIFHAFPRAHQMGAASGSLAGIRRIRWSHDRWWK
jgi:hypothetical protein